LCGFCSFSGFLILNLLIKKFNRHFYRYKENFFLIMPQLDYNIHTMLTALSFSYLFVYITVFLFIVLKPSFSEFFWLKVYPYFLIKDMFLFSASLFAFLYTIWILNFLVTLCLGADTRYLASQLGLYLVFCFLVALFWVILKARSAIKRWYAPPDPEQRKKKGCVWDKEKVR
jgi:hypothetical protein